jgi:hypothetical protein
LRYHIRRASIVPDLDQFGKLLTIGPTQPVNQFRLRVGLLADKEKYGDLSPRLSFEGDKSLGALVFCKLEKLIFLVESHRFAPFCPIMSQRSHAFNQPAMNFASAVAAIVIICAIRGMLFELALCKID